MLERLLGNKNVEKIFFFMRDHPRCYATQLSRHFDAPLSGFQRALEKLEYAGVLVSFTEGKTRIYQFNPKYPLLPELKALFDSAFRFVPKSIKEKYYPTKMRRRPRRAGKPL